LSTAFAIIFSITSTETGWISEAGKFLVTANLSIIDRANIEEVKAPIIGDILQQLMGVLFMLIPLLILLMMLSFLPRFIAGIRRRERKEEKGEEIKKEKVEVKKEEIEEKEAIKKAIEVLLKKL